MVLRPYQVYATEAIVDSVKTSDKNGYIWHTTGSGKTLTSFKIAQILTASAEVDKVVIVVDCKDLDYQTSKEVNSFAKGCLDSTDNTKMLVAQFSGEAINTKKLNENRNTKLIVTTIQKLNAAISKKHYLKKMEQQKDQRIVFFFMSVTVASLVKHINELQSYSLIISYLVLLERLSLLIMLWLKRLLSKPPKTYSMIVCTNTPLSMRLKMKMYSGLMWSM